MSSDTHILSNIFYEIHLHYERKSSNVEAEVG